MSAPREPVGVPAGPPAYLLASEVGALLRLSSKSVYRLASADPTMPALRIGGTIRFPRERLERWLREREQGHARTRTLSALPPKSVPQQEATGA